METNSNLRSGYISIIGRPNVGKSTLLNQIIGEKISIISPKPQTTRNRILGIVNSDKAQIIFLDTPGVHNSKKEINRYMVKTALNTLEESDIVLFMAEAGRDQTEDDLFIIESISKIKTPIFLVVNKIDLVKKETLLELIEKYTSLFNFDEVFLISALNRDGVDDMLNKIIEKLPEGPKYFPEDMITDVTERFIAQEIIREKIFNLTKEEIPYSSTVVIDEFDESKRDKIIRIKAVIYVERESQKGIIIGRGGDMLKNIGKEARLDMEKEFGTKVFLELWVKVEKNWTNDRISLKKMGYVIP